MKSNSKRLTILLLTVTLLVFIAGCHKIDQTRDAKIGFKVTSPDTSMTALISHSTEDDPIWEMHVALPYEKEITKRVQRSTIIKLTASSAKTDPITLELFVDGVSVRKESGDSTNHKKLIILYSIP